MRFQSLARLIAIGLIVAAGLMLLSMSLGSRFAQAQAAATATPRSASTPIAGVSLTYTVKSGDSFNAIARQLNLTPQQLQALNTISDTSLIRVGQVLIVAVNTSTPTAISTETPTPLPTKTSTVRPTVTPTRKPISTGQPTTAPAPKSIAPPAPKSPVGIPLDVILVSAVMFLAVIGLIIGFRTQRD